MTKKRTAPEFDIPYCSVTQSTTEDLMFEDRQSHLMVELKRHVASSGLGDAAVQHEDATLIELGIFYETETEKKGPPAFRLRIPVDVVERLPELFRRVIETSRVNGTLPPAANPVERLRRA
ncbi:MAG TPA: hypothetical protein VGM50_13675 [Gemmatimonadaceae bacterium]|jgi:hypothetical protein